MNIQSSIIIKPIPLGLHRKHICCFIWGVLFGIYRGIWEVLHLRINILCMAFIQSTRLPVPLGITSCVSGSCIATCDCSIVSYGFCINPNMLFHSAAFKTKNTAPPQVIACIFQPDVQMKYRLHDRPKNWLLNWV